MTRDKRRDFTFIKEKIEEILVKRHLDGLKETLTDLLDEWVELFRENYARLEYLIYQYRVNTFWISKINLNLFSIFNHLIMLRKSENQQTVV